MSGDLVKGDNVKALVNKWTEKAKSVKQFKADITDFINEYQLFLNLAKNAELNTEASFGELHDTVRDMDGDKTSLVLFVPEIPNKDGGTVYRVMVTICSSTDQKDKQIYEFKIERVLTGGTVMEGVTSLKGVKGTFFDEFLDKYIVSEKDQRTIANYIMREEQKPASNEL